MSGCSKLATHKPMSTAAVVWGWVGIALEAWLAILLLRRNAHRQFRFFLIYNIGGVLIDVSRLLVSSNRQIFFEFYWETEAIYVLLAFLAIHEVFYRIFKNFYILRGFWALLPGAT